MDGMIRLQIHAAVITPAANPARIRSVLILISSFIRKTHALPKDVPINGIRIPINN